MDKPLNGRPHRALSQCFRVALAYQWQIVLWDEATSTAVAPGEKLRFPWDAEHLFFTVREPFPSKTSGVEIVFGKVSAEHPLALESHMPERGVIFSDGVEMDFLEFNAGAKAEITVAERHGMLVI